MVEPFLSHSLFALRAGNPVRTLWEGDVLTWLAEHKPLTLHLIITGRCAPDALVEFADLVTEMRAVRRPFVGQGIRAQAGIEF
jgi:ATP:corrinoid adenosyltransferase